MAALLLGLSCGPQAAPAPAAPEAGSGCGSDADCAGAPCLLARCQRGQCSQEPAPAGTLPPDDAPGDCQLPACDGQGHVIWRVADEDVPAAQPCNRPVCDGGRPGKVPTPGAACQGDRGAGACTREGSCQATVQFALGSSHNCMLRSDGRVACWGYGGSSQVDGGSGLSSDDPVELPWLTGARAIAAAAFHSCALLGDGSLSCWGNGGAWKRRDLRAARPTRWVGPPPGVGAAVALGAWEQTTCVIDDTSHLACWDESGDRALDPPKRKRLSGPHRRLVVGEGYGCALLQSGEIECTAPGAKKLFFGSPLPRWGRKLKARALGIGKDFACALDEQGSAFCWGEDEYGSLGQGRHVAASREPLKVAGIEGAVDLVSSGLRTCVIDAKKSVRCWGQIFNGHVPQGTWTPLSIDGLADASLLGLGILVVCAASQGGTSACFGSLPFAPRQGPRFGLRSVFF